jgi:hypothetical protein
MIGFGRLMRGDESFLRVTEPRRFTFSGSSRYKAFKVGDRQFDAIRHYEDKYGIPVHDLLYHPLILPYARVIPLSVGDEMPENCEVGCRVSAARAVNDTIGKLDNGYSPAYDDIRQIPSEATSRGESPGWRLEDFAVDRVFDCKEGYVAQDEQDEGLFVVFNRRSGPIAAAIAITFDAPA